MLQDAAAAPNGVERGCEASAVVTDAIAKHSLDKWGQHAPARARRMRDDGPRAGVLPRVSRLVPHFDVGQVRVDAVGIDVERRDGLSAPRVLLTTMLYFGQAMANSVESLLAVAIDNIADLQTEVGRLRDRIHALESTLSGVRVLTKAVEELRESMPTLARRVARETIAEDRAARHSDLFSNLRTYAVVLSVGIALGALIVSLVHG